MFLVCKSSPGVLASRTSRPLLAQNRLFKRLSVSASSLSSRYKDINSIMPTTKDNGKKRSTSVRRSKSTSTRAEGKSSSDSKVNWYTSTQTPP